MRLTELSVERNFLYNIRLSEERLQKLQDQASSGKVFSKPEDDPIGVQRSINLNHHLEENTQYLRNLDRARTWMEHAESGLGQITSLLTRVKELALASLNDTSSADARNAIVMEISELRAELDNIGKLKVEGRSILQGTMPEWELGAGVSVKPEDQTALLAKAAGELADLQNHLSPSTFNRAAAEATLSNMSDTSDQVLAQRAQNGARIHRIEAMEAKMQSLDIDFKRLISDVEDVDLTKLLVELKSAEVSYQAALGAGARLIQPTLLDYLR